jgi:signal transduction histidine kinase
MHMVTRSAAAPEPREAALERTRGAVHRATDGRAPAAHRPEADGARVVDVAELERRRLERGLRDGPERRLNALALRLQAFGSRLVPGSEEADAVAAARRELDAALRELRDLARAPHPAVLGRHGLPLGLQGLAAHSPVPVTVTVDVPERLSPSVEIAAYYLVSEALTNTAKHAGAGAAAVTARSDGRELIVDVSDDGCGGADLEAGTGLRGLADRIAALGGSLELASPPGRGTSLRARLPTVPHGRAAALSA